MTNYFGRLMREQVQESIENYSKLAKKPCPKKGWIRTIREALGISSRALAGMLGCTQSNISALERSEKRGSISLASLEETAKAMNCQLVYCLIPLKPLEKIMEDQARIIAKKQIALINHSMSLEDQGLSLAQLKRQEDDLVKQLLQGNPRQLWKK